MKYELKNQRYTINDNLAANVLVVGFATKISKSELITNFSKIRDMVPLLNSKLVVTDNNCYFESNDINFEYTVEECENINNWINNQYNTPLKMSAGEFLRIALFKDNTLIVFAHNIISDSRGLVNFAKAIYQGTENFTFKYCEDQVAKIRFLDQIKVNKYKNPKQTSVEGLPLGKIKVKKISLKSDIVFTLCSSEGVSLLSFFISVALSLSKAVRKNIMIPFCSKLNEDIILVNDTYNIKFKRGLEPRLSFYDNCAEIDKLLKSFLKNKPFVLRNAILNTIPTELIDNPLKSESIFKFLTSDMLFDVVPTIEEDSIVKSLSFYPSNTFIKNSFGITVVDDKVTICSIVHDKDGEELFASYQKTINLLSKNADIKLNNK